MQRAEMEVDGTKRDTDITSFFPVLGRKRPSPSGQEVQNRLPCTDEDQDTANYSAVAVYRPMTSASKSKHKEGKYIFFSMKLLPNKARIQKLAEANKVMYPNSYYKQTKHQ